MISYENHPLDYLCNPTSKREIIIERISYKLEIKRI